ncbi:MAG: TPM domain-containing protein [Syntrophaceae bacterium]
MKKLFSLALVLALVFACIHSAVAEEQFPPHQGLINDFAGVIPPDVQKEMRSRAKEVLQKTGATVVVVTIPTLGESYIADYANKLYHAWGIGKKGEDRGVLILFALKERKIRIETGYGIEGVLPDGRVGEVLRNDMIPLLKDGKFGEGLLNGLKSVSATIAASQNVELTGRAKETVKRKKGSRNNPWTGLLILAFSVLSLGSMIFARRHGWGPGGGYYGGGYGGGFGGGSGGGDSGDSGFGGGDSGGGGAEGDF